MNSTLDPGQVNTPDALIARLEEANARAYEREQLAQKIPPAESSLSPSSDPDPKPDPSLKTTEHAGVRASSGRARRRRLLFIALSVICICGIAIGWQFADHEAVRQKTAAWTSAFMPNLLKDFDKKASAAQTAIPADQKREADTSRNAIQMESPPEKSTPPSIGQTVAMEQALRVMVRELAILQQGVEQLKISQELITRDYATTNAQLKTSLDETERNNSRIIGLIKTTHDQLMSDNSKLAEQLQASQSDNAKIAEQLQASQDEITRLLSKPSRRSARRGSAQSTR